MIETTPRAFTADELREQVLDHVRIMVQYWANQPGLDVVSRCDGVAFSILTMIDGSSSVPPLSLVAMSSDEDKEYSVENGENWVENGTVLNDDVMLHECYYSEEREELARQLMVKTDDPANKAGRE